MHGPGDTVLSDISPSQEDMHCVSPWGLLGESIQRQTVDSGARGGRGCQFGTMRKFWRCGGDGGTTAYMYLMPLNWTLAKA